MPSKDTKSLHKEHQSLQLFAVVIVILVAYFFGISGINQDPIRRDESTTMAHIGVMARDGTRLSLSGTWDSLMTYSGEHPPFYYFSANIWSDIFSDDYRVLRVLSVFWGVLAVAMVYRLGLSLTSPLMAFWAVVLLTTLGFYHHYLHEIREYAALIFCSATAWWLYIRCITKQRKVSSYSIVALGIATACALYTHPTSFPLFIGIGIYHLLFVPKNKVWWQISAVVVIGGLTFVPWLPGLLSGVGKYTARLASGEPDTLYNNDIIEGVILFWSNGQPWLFVTLCFFSLIATIRNVKNSRIILMFIIVFFGVYFLANGLFPFTKKLRYVIVFTIPFMLWAGVGLGFITRWIRPAIIPIIIVGTWALAGTSFIQSEIFRFQVGTIAIDTFTEYHRLMPILESEDVTDENLTLINTVYNLSTMRDSKRGGMSIDEYYRSQLDIDTQYIRVDINNNQATQRIVDFVTEKSDFYLTYFHTATLAQVRDFREAVEESFSVCLEQSYGERSVLIYYVATDQYDSLCQQ